MDLLADGGLNLFRQVQQSNRPCAGSSSSSASCSQAISEPSTSTARRIIERSDDPFLPTPLTDRIDGAPMEASSEPPAKPAARVVAKRAHLVRQLDPEELRNVPRDAVIEAVFPAPALNQGSYRATNSRQASWSRQSAVRLRSVGLVLVVSSEFIVEFSGILCRTTTIVSAMTEFWLKRVYGLRRTGRG